MGCLQESLFELLGSVGPATKKTVPYPKLIDVSSSKFGEEVSRMYSELGGVLYRYELNLRSWDMEFLGAAVELDEQLHFNRYRRQTLESSAYSVLPGFPLAEYRQFCDRYEGKCLAAGGYGGKWSSPSTIRQFGDGGAPKELDGPGSPRWKQRAFYDFVKDLAPKLIGIRLVRISIWDTVVEEGESRSVIDVLKSPSKESAASIAGLIARRDV